MLPTRSLAIIGVGKTTLMVLAGDNSGGLIENSASSVGSGFGEGSRALVLEAAEDSDSGRKAASHRVVSNPELVMSFMECGENSQFQNSMTPHSYSDESRIFWRLSVKRVFQFVRKSNS